MKTSTGKLTFLIAILLEAGSAFGQPEAPVQIRTDGLPSLVRQRLEAKAQEGPTALIRYVNRTRMMSPQVRIEDIVVTPEGRARMAEAAKQEAVLAKADSGKK